MTEGQLEKRYKILENLLNDKRWKYSIQLYCSFISIRNNMTLDGVYTDSLQYAKRWIVNDLKL